MKRPELMAMQLLPSGLGCGAVDVEGIARSRGLIVAYEDLDDGVSGMLIRRASQPPVIVVNQDHATSRQRFTMAHELGHLMLHPRTGEVHVDYRDGRASEGTYRREREANAFAACLLMPRNIVLRCLGTRRLDPFDERDAARIADAAMELQVSHTALTWRLKALKLLPYDPAD